MIQNTPEKSILIKTGRRIRRVRQIRGKSQKEMASFLEITRQTVICIEYGKSYLPLHTLVRISEFLRIRVRDWFANEKEWNSILYRLNSQKNGEKVIEIEEIEENGEKIPSF